MPEPLGPVKDYKKWLETLSKVEIPWSTRDVAPGRSVCLGMSSTGGAHPQPCINGFTLKHREWVAELLRLIAADPSIPPDLLFSSVHINFDTVAKKHTDANALLTSAIASFGNYSGGNFVTEDDDLNPHSFDIRNSWLQICGQRRHWSEPFQGRRISVILFMHKALEAAPLDLLKVIDELGFRRVLPPGVQTRANATETRKGLSPGVGASHQTPQPTPSQPHMWETFRSARKFLFIHHYAGPEEFNLGEAIVREAESRGLRAAQIAVDKKRDGTDLLAAEPFSTHLGWALDHRVDGCHSGWCCASFSPLRAKKRRYRGMKGPVRSAEFPRGLPSNTEAEQQEADRGTVMATRAAEFATATADSANLRGLQHVATLENPTPPDWGGNLPSAFFLEELVEWSARPDTIDDEVFLCGYGAVDAQGNPIRGRGRWSGSNIELGNHCDCVVPHSSLMDPENARRKAAYPADLCLKYARKTVDIWEANLAIEWKLLSEGRATRTSSDGGTLVGPAAWEAWDALLSRPNGVKDLSIKPTLKRPGKDSFNALVKVGRFGNCLVASASAARKANWNYASPQETGANSKQGIKAIKDTENKECVGGMRAPIWAVRKNQGLRAVGRHVRGVFASWVNLHPQAWQVAVNYGRADYEGPAEDLIINFREALVAGLDAGPHIAGTWNFGQHHYRHGVRHPGSPIQGNIVDRWLQCANDPEDQIGIWQQQGVPLGTEVDIITRGIFPLVQDKEEEFALTTIMDAVSEDFKNYSSVYESLDDTSIELDRYLGEGFLERVSALDALAWFPGGTVHKKAIILKILDDGSLKRRLVLDCRRSGGNSLQRCPERPVLPRGVEVAADTRALFKRNVTSGQWQNPTDFTETAELCSGDFSDAYPHFCIDERELRHCLSKDPTKDDAMLLWVMLFFGLKVAPLLWSRFAAALGRMLQGTLEDHEARVEIYLDDPLWNLWGPQRDRDFILVMHIFVLLAIGIKFAWHKAARGSRLTWIGIVYEIVLAEAVLKMTVGDKLRDDVLKETEDLLKTKMAGIRRARKLAGKANWIAGIHPRLRWCTNIIYAAIRDRERCISSGDEAADRSKRHDARNKDSLIEIRRFKLALVFLNVRLSANKHAPLVTCVPLKECEPTFDIVLDGSPWGCGGLLVHRGTQEIIECFESILSTEATRSGTHRDPNTLGSVISGKGLRSDTLGVRNLWEGIGDWRVLYLPTSFLRRVRNPCKGVGNSTSVGRVQWRGFVFCKHQVRRSVMNSRSRMATPLAKAPRRPWRY